MTYDMIACKDSQISLFLGLLSQLCKVLGLESVDQLMALHVGPILHEMNEGSSEWTPVSPEKLIFELILSHGG